MNKHETIKFGDIIYIEYHNQNQSKKSRIVLTSSGFDLNNRSYIYPKIIPDNQEIYLKDFEDNLFIIFPTMKNEYLQNKSKIDEKNILIKSKVGLNNLNDDFTIKKDLSPYGRLSMRIQDKLNRNGYDEEILIDFGSRHTAYLFSIWIVFLAVFITGFIVHFDTDNNLTASSIIWTFSLVLLFFAILYSYFYYKCSKAKSKEELYKYLKFIPC